jgi:hypothetical protein
MMLPIPHNPKKIEMLLLICATHRQPITITMTCSICQQKGHNKQTCSVVVRYQYDDCGVRCRINPNDDQDFQPVETYCLPCGSPTLECECGEYKCGKWFNEETGKFQGAPRRRRQTRFNPIDHPALFTIVPAPETKEEVATTGKYAGMTAVQIEAIFAERERKNYEELVAPIIAPKLACADCGQVETECRLERLVGGKVMCCDCLYPENQEDDDDETVSVVSEDTCECCGRPYDHRNPHRQSEMCDCVQNDDGTLSRPEDNSDAETEIDEDQDNFTNRVCGYYPECGKDFHLTDPHYYDEEVGECYCSEECYKKEQKKLESDEEVPELPCPDCRRWFDEGRDNCKSCDFDLNSFNKPPSPTRDQLIALGKYKLAKFQIGKREQKDETNWNEDGDDELCSAIDASGNALY